MLAKTDTKQCVLRAGNWVIDAHHRWSTGTLFDSIQSHCIDIENRLNMSFGHGRASAICVMWNCKVTSSAGS